MAKYQFMSSAKPKQHLSDAYGKVSEAMRNSGTIDSSAASAVVSSNESLSVAVADKMDSLKTTMESMFSDLHDTLSVFQKKDAAGKPRFTAEALAQRAQLGMIGAVMASDASGAALMSQVLEKPPANKYGAKTFTAEARGASFYDKRAVYTAEAFQNYDLQNSRIFSTLFNYSIVDFDDFTRTIWRPVTISPDSSFVELLINVLTVFNGYEHQQNAVAQNWRRHNLVRAIADHTILHTDETQAIPSKNSENAEYFSTKIVAAEIEQAGRPITTGPIIAPVSGLDYIGLCMPDWLVKTGTLDQRDNLDPGFQLKTLNIALADDVLSFNVLNEPGTEFNGAVQGDRQLETLNWTTGSLRVDKNTKNADESALTNLASVVSGELVLKIRLDIGVELNLETGELSFNPGRPQIRSLQDKDGQVIAKTDSRYTTIAAALAGYTEISFELKGFRSNADRRQRGQLINVRQFAENVVVPWRDPIAAERPAAGANDQDTSDLTALMSATRIRITNEGVTALFDAEAVLSRTAIDEEYNSFETPTTLGIGRHFVLPYYHHEEMDMLKIVDSLKSSERAADIQAAIVSTLRNRLATAYTESQYKAASDALSGGTAPKPKVALVTDPVTARYIIEPGELRTLVDFELVVVPILDFRMRNKIKMVFITDDGGNDVDYLNFGYLFWSPEHVLVANMSRTGAFNRETQLQPRYRHYVACPVMVSIDISNIEPALKKIALDVTTTDVTPPADDDTP